MGVSFIYGHRRHQRNTKTDFEKVFNKWENRGGSKILVLRDWTGEVTEFGGFCDSEKQAMEISQPEQTE